VGVTRFARGCGQLERLRIGIRVVCAVLACSALGAARRVVRTSDVAIPANPSPVQLYPTAGPPTGPPDAGPPAVDVVSGMLLIAAAGLAVGGSFENLDKAIDIGPPGGSGG